MDAKPILVVRVNATKFTADQMAHMNNVMRTICTDYHVITMSSTEVTECRFEIVGSDADLSSINIDSIIKATEPCH